jgi:hypothetical protein
MVMKDSVKKHIPVFITSAIGALGGFLYWKFIGCNSGTCVIKSVWYLSTLYGLFLGWVLGSLSVDLVKSFKKQKNYE